MKKKFKILFIGDVVGKPARKFLKEKMPQIRKDLAVDCVIANGENAAGGSSITMQTAKDIFNAQVDIVTSGDHIFKKKEAKEVLEKFDVIRPVNFGEQAYGNGFIIKELGKIKICVVNLIGRVFMQPVDCPFKAINDLLEKLDKDIKIIVVDIHAEATSEKQAMGHFLSKKVTAVVGTHTHIPTADERILDDFTAYITDVGMTASFDSVLGREKSQIIERFVKNMPVRFNLAQDDIRIQGVVIECDVETGKALSIKRVEVKESSV